MSGRQRGDAPDIAHDYISFEVKHRASLPNWLNDAMDQAVASMRTRWQIPAVVLHEKHQKISESYVMIRCDSFKELIRLYEEDDKREDTVEELRNVHT